MPYYQVHIVEVTISQQLHVDVCEVNMYYFLPDRAKHTDEADANLGYFKEIFIGILLL